MDVTALILMAAAKYPIVLGVASGLGILVVAGQAAVVLTPTKKDDEALAKAEGNPIVGAFLKALRAFAPIQKKQ